MWWVLISGCISSWPLMSTHWHNDTHLNSFPHVLHDSWSHTKLSQVATNDAQLFKMYPQIIWTVWTRKVVNCWRCLVGCPVSHRSDCQVINCMVWWRRYPIGFFYFIHHMCGIQLPSEGTMQLLHKDAFGV
jgi:hypothetical protein